MTLTSIDTRCPCDDATIGGVIFAASLTAVVLGDQPLRSDKPRSVPLRLGYSDRARVYLDGRLLYVGDNSYRSRDYRYLGTIGLFDEIWLPLNRGENQLWVAVSEDFGGWGILGRLAEVEGVSILEPR